MSSFAIVCLVIIAVFSVIPVACVVFVIFNTVFGAKSNGCTCRCCGHYEKENLLICQHCGGNLLDVGPGDEW